MINYELKKYMGFLQFIKLLVAYYNSVLVIFSSF